LDSSRKPRVIVRENLQPFAGICEVSAPSLPRTGVFLIAYVHTLAIMYMSRLILPVHR